MPNKRSRGTRQKTAAPLSFAFAARLRRAANGASCFASACSSGHRRRPFEQSLERLAA